MYHNSVVNQLSWLLVGENLIISSCYLIIGSVIAYGVWRNRLSGIDPLVIRERLK